MLERALRRSKSCSDENPILQCVLASVPLPGFFLPPTSSSGRDLLEDLLVLGRDRSREARLGCGDKPGRAPVSIRVTREWRER